ncbi:uncharacterized protein DUF4157 [Humibacillus xanthopallidus]|uniref:Uncharacterized protein DUF4157 n=1 Tax=Humibacillus xanthopallidus TaxID=412689 RepID=A0A543PX48_9MICO|nr:uncharacterized protein DUF4157 [Humibacillus xanthopallidus]
MRSAAAVLGHHSDSGEALDDTTLRRLHAALGADFSAVRVHRDAGAAHRTAAAGAAALTIGSHIYVAPGAYRPGEDFALIAHEAVHVLQQWGRRREPGACAATVSRRQQRAWEIEARVVAAAVGGGGVGVGVGPSGGPSGAGVTEVHPFESPLTQAHGSFEHRVLGDVSTADLVAVSTGGASRATVLQGQLALLGAFRYDPDSVDEATVAHFCPWIRTVRLGPDNVLATYGEINALPDYLANAVAIESLGHDILTPVLQVIRQEGWNSLTALLDGSPPLPLVEFAQAACAPWRNSMVNNIVETSALDALTTGLGRNGADHYQGLLSRNACHFAPYSWFRWQSSHIIARDLAAAAYATSGDQQARLTASAWAWAGYADHFLQDSFAAGHLVNKTLVMQWFVDWVTNGSLPVSDRSWIAGMTPSLQPGLSAPGLYVPGAAGPSSDPQTVEELVTVGARTVGSGVVPSGSAGAAAVYQNYLAFLSSAVAQLASANLHDHFNDTSAWVTSVATPTPYEVWGDYTLLSGANGGDGVAATSSTAQLSQQSMTQILAEGGTSISLDDIRSHFPTGAGASSSTVTDIATFAASLQPQAVSQFESFWPTLKTVVLRIGSPRLGISSRDQNLGDRWYANLPDTGFTMAETLIVGQRVFAGSNGLVVELDPASGKVLQHATVAQAGGEVRLASDGIRLYAGVNGQVTAAPLDTLTTSSWVADTGQGSLAVSVLVTGGVIAAGCNGYVFTFDPGSGRQLQKGQLKSSWSVGGDYDTRLASDGRTLYAGSHAYVYARSLRNLAADLFTPVAVPSSAATYNPVDVLWAGGLYAASNGSVASIDAQGRSTQFALPGSGVLTYPCRLATDGTNLYVGTHGYVYAVALSDVTQLRWTQDSLGGYTGGVFMVNVATTHGRVLAGANGFAYDLDPATGTIRSSILCGSAIGVGDYETRLATDGRSVYAGTHGYVYALSLLAAAPPNPLGSVAVAVDPAGDRHATSVDQLGTLWHRMQVGGSGAFTGWADVCAFIAGEGYPDIRPVTRSAIATFASGDLNCLAVDPAGRLWHSVRYAAGTGSWSPWGDVRGTIAGEGNPDIGPVSAVACTTTPTGEVVVLLTDAQDAQWLTVRDVDGTWQAWTSLAAGVGGGSQPAVGPVLSVSLGCDASGTVHALATSAGARLFHGVATLSDGAWTGWTGWADVRDDVVGEGHPDVGPVLTVAGSVDHSTGTLDVVVTGATDVAWHALHTTDGAWTAFGGIDAAIAVEGNPALGPVSQVACGSSSVGDLSLVALDEGGTPWLTVRSASTGAWLPWTVLS